jgi:hypothetical protein
MANNLNFILPVGSGIIIGVMGVTAFFASGEGVIPTLKRSFNKIPNTTIQLVSCGFFLGMFLVLLYAHSRLDRYLIDVLHADSITVSRRSMMGEFLGAMLAVVSIRRGISL